MGISDFIGGRGESIAFQRLAIIARPDSAHPFFIPHYLGGKFRTFDFLVELADTGETPLYFLIQVKTTRKPTTRTQTPPRLRVDVSREDVARMAASPIPAYVVGVSDIEKRAFIVGVRGVLSGPVSSITTAHELTPPTLQRLWDEVRASWLALGSSGLTSSFTN